LGVLDGSMERYKILISYSSRCVVVEAWQEEKKFHLFYGGIHVKEQLIEFDNELGHRFTWLLLQAS
jgi:hypothetical protein